MGDSFVFPCLAAATSEQILCPGHPEAACLVAKSGLFGEALERNLQLQDPCQQETVFCAVSLALAVASQVPESSALLSVARAEPCNEHSFR